MTPDATPRQEERETHQASSYGNASGSGLPTSDDSEIHQLRENKIIATYEFPAGDYFQRGTLTLVGAPDDDARRWRIISEIHGAGGTSP